MNRIDRLQAILTTLQSKRIVTAESLAEKFEVSIRTIYRDIRALEEGGIPIGAEAGIGYYIMEGYHLPPVMFTHEEARVLLLAGKMVEKMSDAKTSKIFTDALTKIQSVLDSAKKEELEDLDAKIIVMPNMAQNTNGEEVLDKIKEALARSVSVTFNYFAQNSGEHSSRTSDPLGLCYYGSNWHMIGFCHLRKDYRDFRVDRISHFQINSQRFKPSAYLSLKQYLDNLFTTTDLIKVVIRVDREIAKHFSNSKYQMGFMQETPLDNRIEMEFAAYSLNYFARWILMMGSNVEIMEPALLRAKTEQLVQDLTAKYLH